jgi:hypothetical protein
MMTGSEVKGLFRGKEHVYKMSLKETRLWFTGDLERRAIFREFICCKAARMAVASSCEVVTIEGCDGRLASVVQATYGL